MSFLKDGTIIDLYEASAVNRSWQVRDHHILNNFKGKTPMTGLETLHHKLRNVYMIGPTGRAGKP